MLHDFSFVEKRLFLLIDGLYTDGVLCEQHSKDIDVSSVGLIRRRRDDGAAKIFSDLQKKLEKIMPRAHVLCDPDFAVSAGNRVLPIPLLLHAGP